MKKILWMFVQREFSSHYMVVSEVRIAKKLEKKVRSKNQKGFVPEKLAFYNRLSQNEASFADSQCA